MIDGTTETIHMINWRYRTEITNRFTKG